MKKILGIMIMLICMIPGTAAVSAAGEMMYAEGIPYDQLITGRDDYTMHTAGSNGGLSDEVYNELYNRVYNAAKNKIEDIDISDLNITLDMSEAVSSVVYNVVYANPDFFYMESSYSYSYYPDSSVIADVNLNYTTHTSDKDAEIFQSKVNYILASVIREEMTDEEKVLALHDYIVDNTEYGYSTIEEDSYTPYAVLLEGKGVCQGYSLAYNLLLGRLGIESKYVRSGEMHHGWSAVKLDGQWYHVDTTWDDPTNITIVNHENFLVSDDKLAENGHNNWDSSAPVCSSDKYENKDYCFIMARCLLKYKDGMFYYEDYKEVTPPVYGRPYYNIGGKYYVIEYVGTKFDGSERIGITEEYYKDINTEAKLMYAPIKIENGLLRFPGAGDMSDSMLFVKTDAVESADETVYAAYYDADGRLTDISGDESIKVYDGYAEMHIGTVPADAKRIKFMYWDKNMKPAVECLSME